MAPRDTDAFVCTYPKCGTTWIQHICSQLMSNDYGPDVGKGKFFVLYKINTNSNTNFVHKNLVLAQTSFRINLITKTSYVSSF